MRGYSNWMCLRPHKHILHGQTDPNFCRLVGRLHTSSHAFKLAASQNSWVIALQRPKQAAKALEKRPFDQKTIISQDSPKQFPRGTSRCYANEATTPPKLKGSKKPTLLPLCPIKTLCWKCFTVVKHQNLIPNQIRSQKIPNQDRILRCRSCWPCHHSFPSQTAHHRPRAGHTWNGAGDKEVLRTSVQSSVPFQAEW